MMVKQYSSMMVANSWSDSFSRLVRRMLVGHTTIQTSPVTSFMTKTKQVNRLTDRDMVSLIFLLMNMGGRITVMGSMMKVTSIASRCFTSPTDRYSWS